MPSSKPDQCHRRGFLVASLASGTALLGSPARAQEQCGTLGRTAYDRYIALMNAQDTRFTEYYADDIQFEMGIRGKAAVVNFYQSQWTHVTETLSVDFFCSDATGAAAQVRSQLRCVRDFEDSSIFQRTMRAGEVQRVRGAVFYTLNSDGLIVQIHGPPPEILQPWQMEAT